VRQEDQEFKASLGYIAGTCLKKKKKSWGAVAHICNPTQLLGKWNSGESPFRPAQGKTLLRPHLNK
jgi:hypothetical protein